MTVTGTTRQQAKLQAQERELQPKAEKEEGFGRTFCEDLFGARRD